MLQQASSEERDQDDEIVGFELGFVGLNNSDFSFIFFYYQLFSKSQLSGI